MKKHNNNGVIYIYASPMDGPSNHHQTPHGANVQSPKRPLLHRCGDGVPKSPGSSDRTGKVGKVKAKAAVLNS